MFVYDVVLLDSPDNDLLHALNGFAAKLCKTGKNNSVAETDKLVT